MKADSPEKERKIGIAIRMLNGAFNHRFRDDAVAVGMDEISIINGWVLGYLDCNSDRDIYQKTLETEFGLGKSTITGLVKLLENNGFITREAVPGDARLKKLVLTQKGIEIARKGKKTLDEMEFSMIRDIDKKDLEIFFKVSDQIRANLASTEKEK